MPKIYCQSCGESSNEKQNFCASCGSKFPAYYQEKPKKIHAKRDEPDEEDDEWEKEIEEDDDFDKEETPPPRKKSKNTLAGVEIDYGRERGATLKDLAQNIKVDPSERRKPIKLTKKQQKALAKSTLAEGASLKR